MPIGRYANRGIRRARNERLDQAIARVAASQGGQIHRDQLRALGLGARGIDHRIAAGRLHRSRWRTYGVGHPRTDREAILHAAVLTCGDGAAVSHRTGAGWLGILPWTGGSVELTIPRQRRARDAIRSYWRVLPADEVTVVEGLPVTIAVRTLFDLAGLLPQWRFRRAVKEVEVQRLHSHLSLADLLQRHPRPPGAALIRSIVDGGAGPANVIPSDGEERFAALVEGAGLPAPFHRYGIALDGDWVEVDFAWPKLRIAVEADSSFHESSDAYETDHSRDQGLLAGGWRVFRVTWRQLQREPELVLARLRRLIDSALASRSLRERHPAGLP